MGKLLGQVILLTRKNLKVRFSHKCLSFCELAIPLFLAFIVGLLVSYQPDSTGPIPIKFKSRAGVSNSPETKFYCGYEKNHWNPNDPMEYNCEKWYNFVENISQRPDYWSYYDGRERQEKMDTVAFVVADKVAHNGDAQDLVQNILQIVNDEANITTFANKDTYRPQEVVKWEQTNKSESELEICILQRHSACNSIYAVVIFTDMDSEVNKKRIRVGYKIRMRSSVNRQDDPPQDQLFVSYRQWEAARQQSRLESFYLPRWSSDPNKFIQFQTLIDRGIIKFIKGRKLKNGETQLHHDDDEKVQISLLRMPYILPNDREFDFEGAAEYVSLIYCLLASLSIFSLMRINTEKSSGFKELLRMHGVSAMTQWLAWLLSSFIVYSIWTLLLALYFWIPFLGGINVLVLRNINVVLYWLLLLLLMIALTTLSFLISVFFERVWTAASIGLLVWILLTVVMMMAGAMFHGLTNWSRKALMLIPTVAFDFAVRLSLNGGGTLETFWMPVIDNVPLTWLHCAIMLLLDSVIFMAFAVYLDNVMPSKYGVSKSPWYVVRNFRKFMRRFTGVQEHRRGTSFCGDDPSRMFEMALAPPSGFGSNQPFESDPENAKPVVTINNLKKRYRSSKIRSVDGLTAKMFEGEIYALLGFNGAGKTTSIGMLTGLFAPTSGLASIFGLDIETDMEEIRQHIGLCPQHNLLYDEMSVVDQIAFFGKLKGLSDPEVKAKELLAWLGMTEKLVCKPEELSGGQKRRVHLAIALIGDTKLAFLDEPTSGLDPESRRGVWDILGKLRGKVTVILTTHDMEEADVLGDRIGIMSEGKMVCSGTPHFLKKYYGVGYNLKMNAVSARCEAEQILKFVQKYISGAKLNCSRDSENGALQGDTGAAISISLPTAQLDHDKMANLMECIHEQKEFLGVDNIGLSLATMEEVFLKVGETVRAVDAMIPSYEPFIPVRNIGRYERRDLRWNRFWALVLKRAAYFCHAPFTMLLLILLFSGVLWLSVIGFHAVLSISRKVDTPQVVSSSILQEYPAPIILVHDDQQHYDGLSATRNDRSYATSYKNTVNRYSEKDSSISVKEFSKDESVRDVMADLKTTSLEDLFQYKQHYLVGASFKYSGQGINITGLFSAYAVHAAPLSINLISKARIKKLYDVDADIQVVNHPFINLQRFEFVEQEYWEHQHVEFLFKASGPVILLVITTSLLISTAAFLPTEERLNKGKQLQLMTGTTPFLYWMSMFTWDFLFFSLANVIITLVYFLGENTNRVKIFTGNGAGTVIYLILECHTFATLWFSYLVSWATCIKTPSDGFLIVNKFAVIVGVLWNVIRHALILFTVGDFKRRYSPYLTFLYYVGDLSGYVLWPVPMHSLFSSMIKLAAIGYQNSACSQFPEEFLRLACEKQDGFGWSGNNSKFMYKCCDNCKENCFQQQPFLSTAPVHLSSVNNGYETHSMIFDLLAMVLSGCLSAFVLYILENLLPRTKQNRQRDQLSADLIMRTSVEQNANAEEGVRTEATWINDLLTSGGQFAANMGFIAYNLNLEFASLKAVNGLSFSVRRGECFGLLGISGSGKTSTFRMITGDVTPTTGNMFSGGLSFRQNRSSYLASMGYCPQFDGLAGGLTGIQMVKLYGALRGIPYENLEEEARIWLNKFGLLGNANKKCAAYSGGMKRRLSVAMALIGNPPLVLLDEPTSGVDPAFRRQFWKVIREVKERGQSIVLTSYTMNECEELCTRLGIMVDGQFKCLGNAHHLKSKFGNGYTLTVRLKKFVEEEYHIFDALVQRLQEKVVETFAPCHVQSQQKALIQFQLSNKSLWYSDIFREMEQVRKSADVKQVIEEYTVTETSLEDVFVSFASGRQKATQHDSDWDTA